MKALAVTLGVIGACLAVVSVYLFSADDPRHETASTSHAFGLVFLAGAVCFLVPALVVYLAGTKRRA